MALFKKAEMTSAYLKMGLMGFAGSGKTFTATKVAIGLVEHMKKAGVSYADRPAFFLDTETGSDWIKPEFEKAGLELHTAKTKAFYDLIAAVQESEKAASILIVDSLTHFWTELTESYAKRKNRTRGLQFEDWAFLKKEWRKFTDQFINSNLHIIVCGRAGYEYDYFTDDGGKKQLEKTGIKMKAEGEMGYEPSLLVLMERETDLATNKVSRTAYVLKDRSTLIDGKAFKNPSFKDFLPHIKFLNLDGPQLGVDTSRTSEAAIPLDENGRDYRRIQRKIALDEIDSLLVKHHPSTSGADKAAKASLIATHMGSNSWTEISELMSLEDLRTGYDAMHQALEKKPSRYARALPQPLNDEIPALTQEPPLADEAGWLDYFEGSMREDGADPAVVWAENEPMLARLSTEGRARMLALKPLAEAAE